MSEISDDALFAAANFSGKARLFPLPNLVLFPHVLQPLHVFEARYRELVEEALDGDRLIAMALLAPGWEADYEGRPPLYPMACLGRIVTHHRLEDGRFNVLLAGLQRIRLVRELAPAKSFREAEAVVCPDEYSSGGLLGRAMLKRRLLKAFRWFAGKSGDAQSHVEPLLSGAISLSMLADLAAYTLELDISHKQQLLDELDVDRRAMLLLEILDGRSRPSVSCERPSHSFPPDFSAN